MNAPPAATSPGEPAKHDPWKTVVAGFGFVLIGAVALVLIRVFEDQVRLGRLIGVVFAAGGLGIILTIWGLAQVVVVAWRQKDMKQIGLVLGAVVALAGGSFGASYWNQGEPPPPGDDFVAAMGKQRDDPAVQQIIARLGSNYRGEKITLEWERQHLQMRFDKAEKLEWARLGGLDFNDGYRGQFPFGLTRDDTPQTVLDKLGPHDEGNNLRALTFKYSQRGVEIHFEFGKVKTVELFPPQPDKAAAKAAAG